MNDNRRSQEALQSWNVFRRPNRVGHHEVKHIKPYGRIIDFTSISK